MAVDVRSRVVDLIIGIILRSKRHPSRRVDCSRTKICGSVSHRRRIDSISNQSEVRRYWCQPRGQIDWRDRIEFTPARFWIDAIVESRASLRFGGLAHVHRWSR